MRDMASLPIRNQQQIINKLALLFENKCPIKARYGTSDEAHITTLLDIDKENDTVVFDFGSRQDLNHHLLNAGKVIFEAEYRGIKVSFTGTRLKTIIHKGVSAFSILIPKSLFWSQRRGHKRVKVPVSDTCYCQLIHKDKEINLKLFDISLSGFSMLSDYNEISDLLIPGTLFEHCKLMLSEAGEGLIAFEICDKCAINPDDLQKTQKIGCKFVKIRRQAEEIVQHYIFLNL